MESIVWMTSSAFVPWKPLDKENIIDDENNMFFFSSFKINICFAKVMKLPFQREESSQPSQSAQ